MKRITPIVIFAVFFFPGFVMPSYSQSYPVRNITVHFHNRIGNTPLELGKQVTNILGNEITIERFRYYVSHFSVVTSDNRTIPLPEACFLIDEEDSSSRTIRLSIPDIPITGIRFLLGVDSLKNVSGTQTGALDPLQGMFWTWNTGYIMAKLEGSSPEAQTAGHRFTYHIGGFRKGMETARNISIPFQQTVTQLTTLHILADINQWFTGKSILRISETPICHSPGALAVRIADNYQRQFSLLSLQ
ncbi:MAG: hypothetical protein KGO92_08650 [Bacteroidota bacterium]|nr:hypothetical protein [Bacteroidota bacterium]